MRVCRSILVFGQIRERTELYLVKNSRNGVAGVLVVEFYRRGKSARRARGLMDTVRDSAGSQREQP